MGLFGASTALPADVNLVVQVAALVLLLVSRRYSKMKRLVTHGQIMAVSVAANIVATALVMVPSFHASLGFLAANPAATVSVVTFLHVLAGVAAIGSGLYLTYVWGFKSVVKECYRRRSWMKPAMYLWLLSDLTGAFIYVSFYLL